jgi:hypothetical protein
MAIYTGNNGRVYIARRASTGLSGVVTKSVSTGQGVALNENFLAVTVTGVGNGAQFRANTAVSTTATTRTCNFTVSSAGAGYAVGNTIYLARYVNNTLVRVTADFAIESANLVGAGIDTEAELVTQDYRIAKIRDWSYNSNSEVIETTALGDVTKTYAPSITSGDGSATLMFYEDDLNAVGAGSTKDIYELVDLLFPRDVAPSVIMSLAVDGGTYTVDAGSELLKTNFIFNAYITSASISVSYGEVVAVNTSFTVDGPLIDVPSRAGVVRL